MLQSLLCLIIMFSGTARSEELGSKIATQYEGLVFKAMTKVKGSLAESSHGTAFVVDRRGYLITNYHVVADYLEKMDTDAFQLEKLPEAAVEVIALDAVNDLALIKVAHVFPRAVKIAADAPVRQGDAVYSLGFPKSEDLTLIQGLFNGEKQIGFTNITAVAMPLNPGMSGGPAINARGEVIGVNRAMQTNAQNISYLSPWEALRTLVALVPAGEPKALTKAGYRKIVVDQILRQEKMLGTIPSRQQIGKVTFDLPLPGIQCGQGEVDPKAAHGEDDQFNVCTAPSLALVNEEQPGLKFSAVAMQTKTSLAGAGNSFQALSSLYDAHVARLEKSRPKGAGPRCGARNVRNDAGVKMVIRFCVLDIPDYPGLSSTFVKIDLTKADVKTSISQAYEGISAATASVALERFIESIKVVP